MNDIEIVKINLSEVKQLQIVARQTFFETFADVNSKENIQGYLEESFTIKKLSTKLTYQLSEFYFAKVGNRIIGYLKINFGQAQTEINDRNALEIERIYVLKNFMEK